MNTSLRLVFMTLSLRLQKGFSGKEDKFGGFLKLQKDL